VERKSGGGARSGAPPKRSTAPTWSFATNSISALFPGELLSRNTCLLRQALRAGRDRLQTFRSAGHPLARSETIQIVIGVDRSRFPTWPKAGSIRSRGKTKPISDFPTISQLVNGQHPGRTKDDAISCFCNNVGLGLQFAAVGSEVLARAREGASGREIPDG
jgi:hypothetical protein